nr:hypothetical protein [Amycolatopsis alkalitolerans]
MTPAVVFAGLIGATWIGAGAVHFGSIVQDPHPGGRVAGRRRARHQ